MSWADALKQSRNTTTKRSMRALAKVFSDDSEVMLDFSETRTDTDCGKAILIRDPDLLAQEGISLDEAERIAAVSTAHEAAHLKFKTDIEVFGKAIKSRIREGAHPDLAFALINLAEDQRVDTCMAKERPGYGDMRLESTRLVTTNLYRKRKEPEQNMLLVLTAKTGSVDLDWDLGAEVDARIAKAAKLMEDACSVETTAEAAELGYKAYLVLYGVPKERPAAPPPEEREVPTLHIHDDDEDTSLPDFEEDEGSEDVDKDEDGDSEDVDDSWHPSDGEEDGEPEVADDEEEEDSEDEDSEEDELTPPESHGRGRGSLDPDKWFEERESEILHGDSLAEGVGDDLEGKKDRRDRKIESLDKLIEDARDKEMRGKLGRLEHSALCLEIERAYSHGVNAGVQLWYYKESEIIESSLRWKAEANTAPVRAMISELTNTFKDTMRKARERDTYLHRTGVVKADRVWRGAHLGDGRIFVRHEEKGSGGYAVKLILDASGSMGYQEESCALAAYGLTRALLNAGMAVSVECFDAIYSGPPTHRLLLPWGNNDATRVLGYRAGGGNRDGFSIRAAAHTLLQRQEQHKLVFILADGAPSHDGTCESIRLAGGIPGGGGKVMIDDAAQAVREIRSKGAKVLGIWFNGGEFYGLEVEKAIFGKDFVPISNLSRFASVVKTYLIRLLQGGG